MTVSALTATGPEFVYSIGGVVACAALFYAWRLRELRGRPPLPPGPPGIPFFGNTFEIDSTYPWLSYEAWGKKYGSLVHVRLHGVDFIIINSAEVARDLMDRRSTVYSDRPHVRSNKTFGMDFNTALVPYGDEWRMHRKMYNSSFGKQTAGQYKPVALTKACQLIENFLDSPQDYALHCKTFATATIMATTYGYDVAPQNDPFVTKIEHLIARSAIALSPLLFAFPFLPHIPTWLPGGGFQKRAIECRALAKEVLNDPVQFVRDNMAAGTAKKSLVRDLLEMESDQVDENIIKDVGGSAFLGGVESSDSSMRVFLFALVLHPEVQAKAQAEIERVVGSDRLPDFDDRPNLPYVEAVYLEALRWRPVAPLTIPHFMTTSDVYNGMYIPKGAIILGNLSAIEHDENQWDNAMAFVPERHLTPEGTLLEGKKQHAFGFGRRICPGMHIADVNVWAAVVTILATVCFQKARDANGNEIEIKVEFTSGLTSGPKPFPCSIVPRTTRVKSLVQMKKEEAE